VLVFAGAQSCRAKTGQFVIDGKNNPDQRTQLVSTRPSPGGEQKYPRTLEHHWYFDFTHDPGLLPTGVTDHGQMGNRHVTALGGVFIHAVLFHLLFRVFLHPMHCGI
jgi:hypothetical protein